MSPSSIYREFFYFQVVYTFSNFLRYLELQINIPKLSYYHHQVLRNGVEVPKKSKTT